MVRKFKNDRGRLTLRKITTFTEMSNRNTITPEQCRAARGLLGWNQDQLADAARISRPTVTSFENGQRTPVTNNLTAIQAAFEAAGIEFIPENGGGDGVRFREPRSKSTGSTDGV